MDDCRDGKGAHDAAKPEQLGMRFAGARGPEHEGSEGDRAGLNEDVFEEVVPMPAPEVRETGCGEGDLLEVEGAGLFEIGQTEFLRKGELIERDPAA